ncbi:MAG: response regulator [Planctomycetaceae bacterium]|nr:response regulator [Planctomycetales bacterium]MCB9873940.1 response regulator [Planctomycetaceae bacterium]MCB9938597.1 response regulator [Planctomycetaceae bacterium]HRX79723.1 response regulator [Pirellulaceae bacterium]
MPTVLIVDDSPLDRLLATRFLEEVGFNVVAVENGKIAIDQVATSKPDVVLTDMQMPELDGLGLVERMTVDHPTVPVIVMTAFGSESIAVAALQRGAASYVPKQSLNTDLVSTVKNVLSVTRMRRETRTMLDSMRRLEAEYVLNNTLEGLDSLIGYLKEQLRFIRLFGEADILRVGTAVYEGLVNAIEHGNLEISSDERDTPAGVYRRLVADRAGDQRFRTRHVYLTTTLTRTEATFTIRDQGPGFDPNSLPDPTAPENVGKVNGRGMFLIRTFMDEVRFNETGNELTMIKRRTL